jgi:hypothetical protein
MITHKRTKVRPSIIAPREGRDPSSSQPAGRRLAVNIMTVTSLLLSACGLFERHVQTACKSHAYVRVNVEDYLKAAFPPNHGASVVLLPFVAPQNVGIGATRFGQFPESFGTEIARIAQGQMLEYGVIPVVSLATQGPRVAPYADMFGGNYEAMEWARTQGYDLVFIGQLEPLSSLESVSITGKLIDVTKQVTLWYGRAKIDSRSQLARDLGASLGLTKRGQQLPEYRRLTELAVSCLMTSVFKADGD